MLISIIIPVYNAEKFIDRSVSSIACQLTDEMELLLVDDGSTDSSGKMCDAYAAINPRIRVIHKENGGPGLARNTGLLAARGEYISFVDADDYVEAATYQTITQVIRQYHPDCIDFCWSYISGGKSMGTELNQLTKDELLGQEVLKDRIIPSLLNLCKDKRYFVYDFVWNKLFRREIIMSCNVRFSETRRTWEERMFVLAYLYHCNNSYSLSDSLYNYVDVPNSEGRKDYVEKIRIIVENYHLYQKLFGKDYDFDTETANTYWAALLERTVLQLLRQSDQKEMVIVEMRTVLQKNVVKHWFSRRIPRNSFEQKVGALIVAGETDHVIRCYEKKAAKDRINIFAEKIKKCVIHVLRKMIGK